MGWWRIKDTETGQVDFEAKTSAPTANALPGKDDPQHLYGGDGPADVMGKALADINRLWQTSWGRDATNDELLACFNFCFNGLRRQREKSAVA